MENNICLIELQSQTPILLDGNIYLISNNIEG